jgi:RimJ/RimL family protein N-acetyltransferase
MSIIYGAKIRLRAYEGSDVPHFYEWVNDPEVTSGLALYLPISKEAEDRWFEGLAQRDEHERPFAIDVREGQNWKLIGNCAVFGIDWRIRSGELGIMIGDKGAWNRGYGTEAIRLLTAHCFDTLNLNRVQLKVYAGNGRAQRAYQKAGFVEEGRLRQASFKQGEYDDVIVMSVLRSDWRRESKET